MAPPRSTPRSLTQMLRDSDDSVVRNLLVARPDLASPYPTTFSQVASRATTRESVRAVLDSLNSLDLWVAQQASASDRAVSAVDIDGVDEETAALALDRLRRLALLWGDASALRPVRALATELARSPLGAAPEPAPPQFDHAHQEQPDRVDEVAAGSAFELVRRIEVLAEHSRAHPHPAPAGRRPRAAGGAGRGITPRPAGGRRPPACPDRPGGRPHRRRTARSRRHPGAHQRLRQLAGQAPCRAVGVAGPRLDGRSPRKRFCSAQGAVLRGVRATERGPRRRACRDAALDRLARPAAGGGVHPPVDDHAGPGLVGRRDRSRLARELRSRSST